MNVIWQAYSDLSCYEAKLEIALVQHHVLTVDNRTQHQQQNQCGFSSFLFLYQIGHSLACVLSCSFVRYSVNTVPNVETVAWMRTS